MEEVLNVVDDDDVLRTYVFGALFAVGFFWCVVVSFLRYVGPALFQATRSLWLARAIRLAERADVVPLPLAALATALLLFSVLTTQVVVVAAKFAGVFNLLRSVRANVL